MPYRLAMIMDGGFLYPYMLDVRSLRMNMHASFYSNYLVSGQESLKAMRHGNKRLSVSPRSPHNPGKAKPQSTFIFLILFLFRLRLPLHR